MTMVIGLTGGVGCGKSTVLELMEQHFNCRGIRTDEVAREQMKRGCAVYARVLEEFGSAADGGLTGTDGEIDRAKLAALVFSDAERLARLNGLTHPAVTEYVLGEVERERKSGRYDYLVVETALLIEGGYGSFCDEIWYVAAPEEERRARLKRSRGYSEQKIGELFARQQSEEAFLRVATAVIDNRDGRSEKDILEQLTEILRKL